ncbi:unnamed protein product, partial [Allacma fusca]
MRSPTTLHTHGLKIICNANQPGVIIWKTYQPGYCPPTWDGWQCWGETEAGITALNTCPEYIYFRIERPTCY